MNWRARTLLKRGKVKCTGFSNLYIFFEVEGDDTYSVRIPKKGLSSYKINKSCSCEAGSLHNVGEECSHIQACRGWLKGRDLDERSKI